jgi:alkanesulfonate monooxygenase SsuD/methylene tetrahydromethanopterin reductase-like flavin-dependent oxidoreductase (luciferase family)
LKDQGNIKLEDSNLIGTPAQIVEKALALRDAGVTHLLGIYFAGHSVQDLLDQMQLFSEEVMPHLR